MRTCDAIIAMRLLCAAHAKNRDAAMTIQSQSLLVFSMSVSCINICARAVTFRQVHAAGVLKMVVVVVPPPTLSFKSQRSFSPSTSPEFTLCTFGIYYLYMYHPLLCTSSAYKVLVLPLCSEGWTPIQIRMLLFMERLFLALLLRVRRISVLRLWLWP